MGETEDILRMGHISQSPPKIMFPQETFQNIGTLIFLLFGDGNAIRHKVV